MTQANILGLGWAATPAGLKAMEELAKLEEERGNPAGIIGPAIVVTFVSTVVAVVYCKAMNRKR